MNKAILTLEKRKCKVISLRNSFIKACDKEEVFEPNLKRYDDLIDKIVKAIKLEWKKLYK
jgi:uncharacterized protein (DUF1919 family)